MQNFLFMSIDTEKKRVVEIDLRSPSYWQIGGGLNLQTECTNRNCSEIGKKIWVHKGYGSCRIKQILRRC